MRDYHRQVVVIGGGAGGLITASTLSRLGYKVTLVEKQSSLGGDCLHYSCVPSKAFINAAKMAYTAQNIKQFGITSEVKIDFAKVIAYVKDVVNHIQKHDNPLRFKSYGVDVLFGNANFVGEHMLSIDNKLIPAEKFVIATGSTPFIPDIRGLDNVKYYTNENILDINQQPTSLIIIGGGAVGLEYAQAFARLGTKVTIIEAHSEFMPGLDRTQMKTLEEQLHKQGVDFISNANIVAVSEEQNKITVEISLENNINKMGHKNIAAEALLIATGRKPQLENLGLDFVGVDHNKDGIIVDACLRTSRKHIYAIGDVVNSPFKLTHMAEYHSGIVVDNLALKGNKKVNYHNIPRIIFTDPEWAQVGLTESMANQQNINHQVQYYPLIGLDRAIIAGQTTGSVKLIVKKNKLLGASILSPCAGELIHELALAMHNNISLSKITQTIHAYPTWSQMHRNAINKYFEPVRFGALSKLKVKILQLFS